MSKPLSSLTVALFGGTGFLGRRIAKELLLAGASLRIVARHPERTSIAEEGCGRFEKVAADIRDAAAVENALKGADAAVNAVGLYVEKGDLTFQAIHVEGARRLADLAWQQGCGRLVHISGIAADATGRSGYLRARGLGEEAVQRAMTEAIILRPSALFAESADFVSSLVSLASSLPIFPLFGRGETRLQPVFADDVARAAVAVIAPQSAAAKIYELGGPEIYRYRDLVEMVMQAAGKRPLLLPLPFQIWSGLATLARFLPNPPLTEGQVALMRRDNIASPDLPGLKDLGITPTRLDAIFDQRFGAA